MEGSLYKVVISPLHNSYTPHALVGGYTHIHITFNMGPISEQSVDKYSIHNYSYQFWKTIMIQQVLLTCTQKIYILLNVYDNLLGI